MELHVFNSDFERVITLNTCISLVWDEFYQEAGSIMLVCQDTPENVENLIQGNRLWMHGKKTSMIIEYVKKDSATRLLTVHGHTAVKRMGDRVVHPTQTVSNVEDGMKQLVMNNLRDMTRLTVEPLQGFMETFDTQFTGQEIQAALKTLAVESGLGYYFYFDHKNKQDEFRVYKGRDLTYGDEKVLFKEDFGNLPNMRIINDDTLFKNVAYVGGEGEGDERIWVIVGDATGDARREMYVDAHNMRLQKDMTPEEYTQQLAAKGVTALNTRIKVNTFVASVEPTDFGVLYYLGDLVVCTGKKYGVTLIARMMAYTEVWEKNKQTLSVTLGNPEITIADELRLNNGTA